MKSKLLFTFSWFALVPVTIKRNPNKPQTNSERPICGLPRHSATFQVPEGFKIEIVASEPMIADPVAMDVDENGSTCQPSWIHRV